MSSTNKPWYSRIFRSGDASLGPNKNSFVSVLPRVEDKKEFIVTPKTAVKVPSVLACVNAIADTIAMLPINVVTVDDGGNKVRLDPVEDDRARTIGEFWNTRTTAHAGMRYMIHNYLLEGVCYALVDRKLNGVINNIIPLANSNVRCVNDGYALTDRPGPVSETTDIKAIPFGNMIAIRYDSSINHKDTPVSPITFGADTIKLAHEVENRLLQYFINGAPDYLIALEFSADREANQRKADQILESQREMREQGYNYGLISGDARIEHIGNTPEQAQIASLWVSSVQSVARLFRCPPSVIGENSQSTFSNAAQQASAFLRSPLQPIIDAFEQEMNLKIFGQQQSSKYRVEFNTDDFERTDVKTARELLVREVEKGIRSRNEARAALGLKPSDQEGADMLFVQLQDQPLIEDGDDEIVPDGEDDEQDTEE